MKQEQNKQQNNATTSKNNETYMKLLITMIATGNEELQTWKQWERDATRSREQESNITKRSCKVESDH